MQRVPRVRCHRWSYADLMPERGALQRQYLQAHPDATIGLELCAYFEAHPSKEFTRAELKAAVGCSDRIIREHVPEAVNSGTERIRIDKSRAAWTYTYVPG